jgi:hypothetical protein
MAGSALIFPNFLFPNFFQKNIPVFTLRPLHHSSATCQKADWELGHKTKCKQLATEAASGGGAQPTSSTSAASQATMVTGMPI